MNNYQLRINNHQLPEGYKQTEVGVIPEDWDATTLGNVAEVIMGQSPKGTSYNRDGNGLPLINGPTEFTKKYPIKVQWTTEPTKLCKPLDLLLCVRGSSTGRMNIANDTFCIGRGVAAIRANPRANTEYLTYQVHLAIEKLLALSAGSTFPSVDGKAIKSISLACPGAEEQRSLAQVLSDVDALIAALDKLIAKKRNLKTATMQQLLTGKKRLPGFGEGQGYKESAIGLIPEDWDALRLGDIAPLQRGFDLPTSQLKQGDYPVVYSNGTMNHHSDFMVNGPGVVTGRSGTIGNVHYVSEKYWPHNTALWVTEFRCSNPRYVYYLYKSVKLERFGSGSGVPTLNRNDVHNWVIAIPKIEEQSAIATVLSDMDAEIAALESRLTKTQALKQGMMQELLTGRTRLIYSYPAKNH